MGIPTCSTQGLGYQLKGEVQFKFSTRLIFAQIMPICAHGQKYKILLPNCKKDKFCVHFCQFFGSKFANVEKSSFLSALNLKLY